MDDEWPFDTPKNTAVFTTMQIVFENAPILSVYHDADGDWQFLGLETDSVPNGSIVGLGNIVSKDPTLRSLADMPSGWVAWRTAVNLPWNRKKLTTPKHNSDQ